MRRVLLFQESHMHILQFIRAQRSALPSLEVSLQRKLSLLVFTLGEGGFADVELDLQLGSFLLWRGPLGPVQLVVPVLSMLQSKLYSFLRERRWKLKMCPSSCTLQPVKS